MILNRQMTIALTKKQYDKLMYLMRKWVERNEKDSTTISEFMREEVIAKYIEEYELKYERIDL